MGNRRGRCAVREASKATATAGCVRNLPGVSTRTTAPWQRMGPEAVPNPTRSSFKLSSSLLCSEPSSARPRGSSLKRNSIPDRLRFSVKPEYHSGAPSLRYCSGRLTRYRVALATPSGGRYSTIGCAAMAGLARMADNISDCFCASRLWGPLLQYCQAMSPHHRPVPDRRSLPPEEEALVKCAALRQADQE